MFLEFPINHVNINSEIRRWQIETGPILFPIINKEKKSYEYLPSFVHFNDLNRLDVFYDYPYGVRSGDLDE